MRALPISRAGSEYVQSRAHCRHAEKLVVQLASLDPLLLNLGDVRE
jgi:hypothetical protein